MKVKELIKLLLDCDYESEVLHSRCKENYSLSKIKGINNIDNKYIVIYED